MSVSRRSFLVASLAAFNLRRDPIRIALAPGVGGAFSDGVRFGMEDGSRAVTLMGRTLDVSDSAPVRIREGGLIEIGKTLFSVKAEPSAYAEVRQRVSLQGSAAVEWHHSLERYGAGELNERFRRYARARMSSDHWLGWIAVKVIIEAHLRARDVEDLPAVMARTRYDGHKGVPLSFSQETRNLRQPLYLVDPARDVVVWPER
jgi:hypothetical protein